MEQVPVFRRSEIPVVGSASDEKRLETSAVIQERFAENRDQIPSHGIERLKMLEHPKQDFEKSAIREINNLLNEVLQDCGIDPFDIPEENIYLVPESLYKEINDSNNGGVGVTKHWRQAIVLNVEELEHRYAKLSVLLHEMIHLKNFISVEASEEGSDFRRLGLEVRSTLKRTEENGKTVRQFLGLNEAVVSLLQKKLLQKIIDRNPYLNKEKEFAKTKESEELVRKVATERKIPEDEIIYAKALSEKTTESYGFTYYAQREVLQYIIDVIQKANPDEFASKDDVFRLFLQAHFTGRLLPLARVIKSTFGPDAFRMIGTMTGDDEQSAYKVLTYLKKKTHLDLRYE